MKLEDYFSVSVRGYLFGDIRTLLSAQADARGFGACNYPLTATVCAGIEAFGALLKGDPLTKDRDEGRQNFLRFWERMHPGKPSIGTQIYRCVRNGLAHAFMTTGPFGLHRGSPSAHLVRERGAGFISVEKFAETFIQEADAVMQQGALHAQMQARLDEMLHDFEVNAFGALSGLPIGSGPIGGGASGLDASLKPFT